ncbi:hypothetical protein KKI24_30795 [bacterium]|nr:hypothetical protein [bacterium]
MKVHPRLWVYNYDFEFELANELRTYRKDSGFHPWYFLNRSWHVMLPLSSSSDNILVYENPHPQISALLKEKLGYLPGFVVLQPAYESNAVFEDLKPRGSVHLPAGMGTLVPWGWSPKAVAFGKEIGSYVPEKKNLQTVNRVNSKITSHLLRQHFLPQTQQIPDRIIEETDLRKEGLETLLNRFLQHQGPGFIKHPYGSAGRLSDRCASTGFSGRKIRKWENWIRATGGILLEKAIAIKQEWSIQVQIDEDGILHPIALTRLFSGTQGNYLGTVVADEDQNQLDWHRTRLSPVLDEIVAMGYQGPLGVDLIETVDGTVRLLEINGRLTMGRIAFEWHRAIADLPVSLLTTLFFRSGGILETDAILDRIRESEQQFGCRMTLLNVVPDLTQNSFMIALLIAAEKPAGLWQILDDIKQRVKRDLQPTGKKEKSPV